MIKHYLVLAITLCCINQLQAQNKHSNLYESVPKDSLSFMAYINADNLKSEAVIELIHSKLPSELSELISYANEFCFYITQQELYTCYTLKFRNVKNIPINKVDSLLTQLNLKITSIEPSFIKLHGEGTKKGYVRINDDQYTLKLYAQAAPINEKIRKEYQSLTTSLNKYNPEECDDYEKQTIIYEQLDSLGKADSVYAVNYFDHLIEIEKKGLTKLSCKKTINIHSIFKGDINQSTAIIYQDAQQIQSMPYHLYSAFNIDFYDFYDWINSGSSTFNYYDNIWLNLKVDDETIKLSSVFTTHTKQKLYRKIDKSITHYLPANQPNLFWIYNLKLSTLKYYLAKNIAYNDFSHEQKALVKLAALALDDDLLNMLGDGFLSITDSTIAKHDVPNFKLALKMPNDEKGKLLLSILCDDLNAFTQVSSNCYQLRSKHYHIHKEVNLYIDGDIWVMGTEPIESLKTKLNASQIKQLYPKLRSKSASQHLYISDNFMTPLSIGEYFENIKLQSYIVNKKSIKSTLNITLQPEPIIFE